ncbi:hypothetical protein [Bacillus sp. 0909A]|uniref:hypothetical protein n=1 Tax=Bacillus sp. 0909A TaxID=3120561 RepID=UPI002FD91054
MLILTIEIIVSLTVLGLFAWTFKRQKNVDDDVFNYARYMIYLLLAEVAIYLVFQIV